MSIYEPVSQDEIMDYISKANINSDKIYTLDNLQDDVEKRNVLSFNSFNRIREIDLENLTAQVERGVTLKQLHEAVASKGLMFAPYTPDIEDFTIGDFYGNQISSLTGAKYSNAKLHVMGLEVILPNGELLKTGGKTVKNVTGYDLTRMFISSRDSIGLPIVFTLKLLPKEEVSVSYLINISSKDQLQIFINKLIQIKVVPAVCCMWNEKASKSINKENLEPINLLIELRGIEDRIDIDQKNLIKTVQELNESIMVLNDLALKEVWETSKSFRNKDGWQDCYKVPIDKIGDLINNLNLINKIDIGVWGNPLQGKINLILPKDLLTKEIYNMIGDKVKELNGGTSWYYDVIYKNENNALNQIYLKIKSTFDPHNIFNPVKGGE